MKLMQERGHEVALFSMSDPRGEDLPYAEFAAPRVDFKDRRLSMPGKVLLAAHAIYSRQTRLRLRRLIREFRPEVAHVRNIYHHLSPSVFWELRAQHVPVIYHLNDFKVLCPTYNFVRHGEPCERCRTGKYWHVLSAGCYSGGTAEAAVLAAEAYTQRWLGTYKKCVDRFLAPSRFVRDKMVQSGWAREQVEFLYHFQRLPAEPVTPPAADAPILYVGRLSAEKGVSDLLHAMRDVRQAQLLIAGDGPQKRELEDLAERLELSNVIFLGHVNPEGLHALIAQSAFTVLPSHAYETLGKSILESYAHGRTVVASDLGSRRELVQHGETGLLYAPGKVLDLAVSLRFLHQRPQLAHAMGLKGRELVETQHDPESHYRALVRLYAETAARRRLPRAAKAPVQPQKPLRVAFIGGRGVISRYSGIEAYYEEVGQQLTQRGHEVTVYCRNYFTPAQAEHNGMRLLHLPTVRTKHLDTPIHTLLSTLHACRAGYDIVHFHALGPALFSWIPRCFGIKTAVTVQGLDWQRKKWGRMASWVLRAGEMAAVHLPSQTMVVSRTLQNYFRVRHGKETLYVPNGTRLRKPPQASTLAERGLDLHGCVLFLGRFSPEKNCHLLVEAFERLEAQPDVKLVLAGGSSYTNDYVRKLKRHASERVIFLDWVTGVALDELLTQAAVFVLPSDLEGLSLALLDAMGAGVCVLTSNIPENVELVEGAGFTFEHGNAADLTRMLQLLLGDPEIRRQAGEAAQRRVAQSYMWPEIVSQIDQAYRELAGVAPALDGQRRPPTRVNVVPHQRGAA